MEKQGQLNTRFQERYFVLWPREECKLVARGFRVLYYFNSPTASAAKGRVRIEPPCLVEDLTKEYAGQCDVRINPNREAAKQADQSGDAILDSLLEIPLDVRPLTLRWHSSDPNENLEQMLGWSESICGGRRRAER